jgi:hypothetical protein
MQWSTEDEIWQALALSFHLVFAVALMLCFAESSVAWAWLPLLSESWIALGVSESYLAVATLAQTGTCSCAERVQSVIYPSLLAN